MGKQKSQPNQSREAINYHRLSNMGQLMIKMNQQLDIVMELLLATDDEKALMRKQLEEQNEQLERSREQNNEAGDNSGSDLDRA